MRLMDLSCAGFCERLSSAEPAPGGGAAAAMAGAQGASLCSMVARLTLGRERYAEHEALINETLAVADSMRFEFLNAADADAEAYNAVAEALRMPKTTKEEKTARRAAVQEALKRAAGVPLSVMELSLKTLRAVNNITGKSNINVASDLGAASHMLRAAVNTAWLNVSVNLKSIRDEIFVSEARASGERILAEALKQADEIENHVLPPVPR